MTENTGPRPPSLCPPRGCRAQDSSFGNAMSWLGQVLQRQGREGRPALPGRVRPRAGPPARALAGQEGRRVSTRGAVCNEAAEPGLGHAGAAQPGPQGTCSIQEVDKADSGPSSPVACPFLGPLPSQRLVPDTSKPAEASDQGRNSAELRLRQRVQGVRFCPFTSGETEALRRLLTRPEHLRT